jgi:ribosomal protein S18 acetylase RimI-like enzyme
VVVIAVQQAERAYIKELARTLGRAFFDDPVATWMLPDPGRRAKGLPLSFAAVARHHFLRGGGMEIASDGPNVAAAALWSPPKRWKMPLMARLRTAPGLFRVFGSDVARARLVDELMKKNHPAEPHWYLAVIGSDPTYRGQGYAHALMKSRLDRLDDERAAAYLESSNPDNVPYYQRYGFEVVGEIELPDGGPTLVPMWREPAS